MNAEDAMQEQQKTRLHALVQGRVQGVGFRYFVLEQAQKLALSGWVRNLWDGRVEVLAEGEQANLEKFLIILRRGPIASRVSQVTETWQPASQEFSGFHVRQSG